MTASNGHPRRAVLYARYSPQNLSKVRKGNSDPKAPASPIDDRDSVERQLQDMAAECAKLGWEIVGQHFDKAMSGADYNRPGLDAAISSLARGDVLMVRNLNRLARDCWLGLSVSAQVRERGAEVYSMEDGGLQREDPDSKLLRVLKYAIAEHHREVGNLRTSRKMRAYQKVNRRMGRADRIPYGKELDPDSPIHESSGQPMGLRDNPEEMAILDMLLQMDAEGESISAIKRHLNHGGWFYRDGKRWTRERVRRVLARSQAAVA